MNLTEFVVCETVLSTTHPGIQCSAISTVIVANEQTEAASSAAELKPTKPYFCDSTG